MDVDIDDLKAKHGDDLHVLEHDDAAVIVKTPPPSEWKRFRAMGADEQQRPMALETLTRACVVWPEAAQFGDMLKRRPGLAETFGNELTEIAGLARSVTRKKL